MEPLDEGFYFGKPRATKSRDNIEVKEISILERPPILRTLPGPGFEVKIGDSYSSYYFPFINKGYRKKDDKWHVYTKENIIKRYPQLSQLLPDYSDQENETTPNVPILSKI